eukprot:8694480-Alexandrium_andersonii.AAC.1
MGEDCFYTAIWGAAKRRHKSLCQSALAHSVAPVWGWLRRGPSLPLPSPTGRLGHSGTTGART